MGNNELQAKILRLEQERDELQEELNKKIIIPDYVKMNKQIDELKQENERLYNDGQTEITRLCNENNKLISALEEIREIITNNNSMIIDRKVYLELQCGEPVALKLQKIYEKINEALNVKY